jgi:hypothetical protein
MFLISPLSNLGQGLVRIYIKFEVGCGLDYTESMEYGGHAHSDA